MVSQEVGGRYMKYYTSDLHFGHSNIIKYEDRPFENVSEMNEYLIQKWNNKVSKNDEVYILGDFGFLNGEQANEILQRLNGRKYLIIGNHDYSFLKDKKFNENNFEWTKRYECIKDGKDIVCMFHFPIYVWDRQHYGSYHLYGHIHSDRGERHPLVKDMERAFNVGTDVCDFEPKTLEELKVKNSM